MTATFRLGGIDGVIRQIERLIGRERLEDWDRQIAAYWGRTVERIDDDQLRVAIVRLWPPKERPNLVSVGRRQRARRLAERESRCLVSGLAKKVREIVESDYDLITGHDLELELHDYSEAEVHHEGRVYHHKVAGLVCVTGGFRVQHQADRTSEITVFSRWISHPFWQYVGKEK